MPRIQVTDHHCLVVRSSWLLQIVCVFAYAKEVVVNKNTHLITLRTRWLWGLTQTRYIHFKQIGCVQYGADRIPIGWRIDDAIHREWSTIWLLLQQPHEVVKLWTFLGVTDKADVGIQNPVAREFVRLLRDFTGKPVG